MDCDVCGESISNQDGLAVPALMIDVVGANPSSKRVKEVFGKNKFRICYVCQLISLGVKKVKR